MKEGCIEGRERKSVGWGGKGEEWRKNGDRGSVSGDVLFKEVSPHLMSLV